MNHVAPPSRPDPVTAKTLARNGPRAVCLLRLSALGDTCHVIPLLRTLQTAWPACKFTWIIGRNEARLMSLLDDVELVTMDKRGGLRAYRELSSILRRRRFDVLLHLQLSLRASAIAAMVRAPIKVGFDRARARELQWLFTNRRIAARQREHVLDSFFGFAESLGVRDRVLRWDVPLPDAAKEYAARLVPTGQPTLVISPCSNHRFRNWSAERYAAVADFAAQQLGLRVIICGGPSRTEREIGAAIQRAAQLPLINQIGNDTLPQFLALIKRAAVLLTPDSGPAHMATMVGTPVIGLYAATNPERSGPYLSRMYCVDRYDEAARRFRGRPSSELAWTTKIEEPGVMGLITVPDVVAKLEEVLRAKI